MLLAFSVAPAGEGDSTGVSEAVAAAVRVVRESGLPHETTAMFTTVEGEWDEVMEVVKKATDVVAAQFRRARLDEPAVGQRRQLRVVLHEVTARVATRGQGTDLHLGMRHQQAQQFPADVAARAGHGHSYRHTDNYATGCKCNQATPQRGRAGSQRTGKRTSRAPHRRLSHPHDRAGIRTAPSSMVPILPERPDADPAHTACRRASAQPASSWGSPRDSMAIMQPSWVGRQVQLRVLTPEDRPTLVRFDREAARNGNSNAGYRHWAAHRAVQTAPTDEFQLAIETLRDGVLVGSLSTAQADPHAGRFSYGVGIGQQYQRNGYANDAIGILLTFMFGERRYHKCEVGIYGFNEASLALHRKLGFQQEGRLREHEFFGGHYHDLVMMGVTAGEFADRLAHRRP